MSTDILSARKKELRRQAAALRKQLNNWLVARPKLFCGTCPYARSLLWAEIKCQKELHLLGEPGRIPIIKSLWRKMHELPPTTDPPAGGSFFIAIPTRCARIVLTLRV
jgi:hypothetical protein